MKEATYKFYVGVATFRRLEKNGAENGLLSLGLKPGIYLLKHI